MHAREELPGRKSAAAKAKAPSRTPTPRTPAAAPHPAAVHAPTTPAAMLALQRAIGNQAVQRRMPRPEREQALEPEEHVHGAGCGHGEAKAPAQAASGPDLINEVLASPSQAPSGAMASEMSSYYGGHDFSPARVHTGPVAQRAADAMGAKAMTIGNHVILPPAAAKDKATVAHEFDHLRNNMNGVVEKGPNSVDGVPTTDHRQGSEVAADHNGAAFAAGAKVAPSIAAQRAVDEDAV